jgi:drug/metabolite transporter (DMT)-like permease
MFIYVQPLVAMTLANLVLGESPSPRTAAAAVLIFAGIALATWPVRSSRAARADSPDRT